VSALLGFAPNSQAAPLDDSRYHGTSDFVDNYPGIVLRS
jgi:hypothetical protein